MPTPAYSAEFYTNVLLGKETSWGVAATTFGVALPSRQPRFQPKALRHILDDGYRGFSSEDYDLIPGPGEGTFSWQGNAYIDTIGALLNMMLGTDAITGTGPYVHALSQSNTPPSYTVQWQQNVEAWNFAGGRLSELTLNWNNNDGALTYSAQGMGKLGATVAPAVATYPSEQAIAGWQSTITVGGSAPASLLEGQIKFTRGLKPIHASNNTQDLANLYALRLKVEAQLTFDFTGVAEYGYFAQAQKNAVVITFTQGASSILAITMSAGAWRLVEINESQEIYTAVASVTGTHNATDGGVCAVSLTNNVSTAY